MTLDYQRVVEYLRDLRQSSLQSVTDEIAQAAADYAALCVQANERLRKCSSFLQQGLRSEAIHMADENPNLLDLVAALDLPDPQTWTDYCQNNGLAVPPPLQLDRAQQLNEAYSQDQPLEHLLARHRLLALSRAPVRERLNTMRRIAQLDQGNAAWEKDIRVFEKARLHELPHAFHSAVKNRQDQAIADLMAELTQEPWFEAIPVELSTAVSDAYSRMQRIGTETELRKLLVPLRDAYAAQSLHECKGLVARWKKIMAHYQVTSVAPELTDEIKPVVAFITEQEKREDYLKRFRDSCTAFSRMLDQDASDSDLEAGYARLHEFKEPIPEELTQRYAGKQTYRQQRIERTHKLRLTAATATAAAVVIVVLVSGYFMMQSSDAAKWAQKIRAANQDRNIPLAQKYIEELKKSSSSLARDASVAAAIRDTDQLIAKRDRDSVQLQDNIQRLTAAAAFATPIDANPAAPLEPLLDLISSLEQTLAAADSHGDLSWVDIEKKYAAARIELDSLLSKVKNHASNTVRAEVEQADAKISALSGSPSEQSATLSQVSGRMTTLKNAHGIDPDAVAAATALLTKIDQHRSNLEALQNVAAALDAVRQATTPDDLAKALAAFAEKYPDDPRTAEFIQAKDRLSYVKSIDAWLHIVHTWGKQMSPSTSDKAQQRADSVVAYLKAYPASPLQMYARTYVHYARRAVDALAEKGTWQVDFNDIVTNPLLIDLALMKTSDGKQFYVLDPIKLTQRSLGDKITYTFESIDPNDLTKRLLVTVDPPIKIVSDKPVKVPHALVVADLADDVKRVNESNWDTWGIDLIDRIRHNKDLDQDREIVVQAILVQQAIKTMNNVSDWALGSTYQNAAAELARQQPDQIKWWDLDHPEKITNKTRDALKEIITAIPPADKVKSLIAKKKEWLFKMLQFDPIAIGVAMKDDTGKWTVTASTGTAINGNLLWTIIPPAPTP
ncbi:MAG: hypothetical protein FWD61_19665, partial [Phycisphaerales bacterium]|nr:hypothetical protein [Phycisphaerales bacterium]